MLELWIRENASKSKFYEIKKKKKREREKVLSQKKG